MEFDRKNFDPARLRPWLDKNGQSWVTVRDVDGGTKNVLCKEKARLTPEEWADLDGAVLKAFNHRVFLTRLIQEWSSVSGFDGLHKTEAEQELMNDSGEEVTAADMPRFVLRRTPLPITHSNFSLNQATVEKHRQQGIPLDPSTGELSARRVGEAVENCVLFGNKELDIHGLLGHPGAAKVVKTADPAADLRNMLTLAKDSKFWGPFLFLHNRDGIKDQAAFAQDGIVGKGLPVWPKLVGEPDSRTRYRLLPEGAMLLAQMTPDVIRILVGQEPIVVQWEDGFKVLCVIVPQLRSDFYGQCGIVRTI